MPWFPASWELGLLGCLARKSPEVKRLARRRFDALAGAPLIQGRRGEWGRLLRRKMNWRSEGLAYEANDWLMRTMAREVRRGSVDAVHSYEDCSLGQFEEAKKLGKRCIYDMPIGYYGWWKDKEAKLAKKYADWLPEGGLPSSRWVRPDQKRREMELADVVLAPSSFVAGTIVEYFPKANIKIAPYGTSCEVADDRRESSPELIEGECRFLFAGTACVRKGLPLLLELWKSLGCRDSKLSIAGSWQLSNKKLQNLPEGVNYLGRLDPAAMRGVYRRSDWLVLPSNFEGYGLVILEALSHGCSIIASDATGAIDLPSSKSVKVFPADNADALASVLSDAKRLRGTMIRQEAMDVASRCTWTAYRQAVARAVD